MSPDTYRKKFSSAILVAQGITVALLIVFWRMDQKWVVFLAVAVFGFMLFGLPGLIRRREAAFHRRAMMLLSTGNAEALVDLANRQFLLSWFGASAPIDARLGLAYTQMGRYADAVACLSAAIPFAPSSELPALQAAWVKALMVTGDPEKAEAEGRHMLESGGPRLAEVLVLVARSRLGLKKRGPLSVELLTEAENLNAGDDVRLMLTLTRIETDLAYGHRVADVPDTADSRQRFLRVWIHLVRGRIQEARGHREAAVRHYVRAVKEGSAERCWFSDMARARLSEQAQEQVKPESEKTNVDDVARRKQKKRR